MSKEGSASFQSMEKPQVNEDVSSEDITNVLQIADANYLSRIIALLESVGAQTEDLTKQFKECTRLSYEEYLKYFEPNVPLYHITRKDPSSEVIDSGIVDPADFIIDFEGNIITSGLGGIKIHWNNESNYSRSDLPDSSGYQDAVMLPFERVAAVNEDGFLKVWQFFQKKWIGKEYRLSPSELNGLTVSKDGQFNTIDFDGNLIRFRPGEKKRELELSLSSSIKMFENGDLLCLQRESKLYVIHPDDSFEEIGKVPPPFESILQIEIADNELFYVLNENSIVFTFTKIGNEWVSTSSSQSNGTIKFIQSIQGDDYLDVRHFKNDEYGLVFTSEGISTKLFSFYNSSDGLNGFQVLNKNAVAIIDDLGKIVIHKNQQ